MLIRSIMIAKEKLTTLSPDITIKEALLMIESKGFLSLPVLADNKYLGLISKERLYEKFIQSGSCDFDGFGQAKLRDYVEQPVQPVPDTLYIEEAADIFFHQHVRFLPVVGVHGHFQGIITQKSLFSVITRVYGLLDAKIIIHSDDFVGSLSKILSIIEKSEVNVTNIAQYDTQVMGIQEISIRVVGGQLEKLVDRLKEKGIKVKEFIPAK